MLDKVCCILDVDGFSLRLWSKDRRTYRNEFLVRELGYVRVDPECTYVPCSYLFDLRGTHDFNHLPDDVERTLRYQSRVVTGLSLFPGPSERNSLEARTLPQVVTKMYDRCRREDAPLVGFKGGHRELDLLKGLGIPSVDLERFGCPTFEEVKASYYYVRHRDCGNHREVEGRGTIHCPLAEVAAYRDWFMMNVQRYRSIRKQKSCTCASAACMCAEASDFDSE